MLQCSGEHLLRLFVHRPTQALVSLCLMEQMLKVLLCLLKLCLRVRKSCSGSKFVDATRLPVTELLQASDITQLQNCSSQPSTLGLCGHILRLASWTERSVYPSHCFRLAAGALNVCGRIAPCPGGSQGIARLNGSPRSLQSSLQSNFNVPELAQSIFCPSDNIPSICTWIDSKRVHESLALCLNFLQGFGQPLHVASCNASLQILHKHQGSTGGKPIRDPQVRIQCIIHFSQSSSFFFLHLISLHWLQRLCCFADENLYHRSHNLSDLLWIRGLIDALPLVILNVLRPFDGGACRSTTHPAEWQDKCSSLLCSGSFLFGTSSSPKKQIDLSGFPHKFAEDVRLICKGNVDASVKAAALSSTQKVEHSAGVSKGFCEAPLSSN
mmetsp:Transcript_9222/g.20577  ORF Transcript_9222/g.20577 Transcript_9222/m.20577 type:complete len:383 (-) Transcript_9222:1308-2456(-)